ncbi:MAG: hypothetical protein PsegKO_01780 [Pseudohongiellaceae bacterium]
MYGVHSPVNYRFVNHWPRARLRGGRVPILGPFTPEKALENGLFPALSAGLNWRVGNPAAPHPLVQWQPGQRSTVRTSFRNSLYSYLPNSLRTSDQRETKPTNTVTPTSARSVGQDGGVVNKKSTAQNGVKKTHGTAPSVGDTPLLPGATSV